MNLFTIENLYKNYTEKMLFEDMSFSMEDGEKVALIGVNGTGKSTLLRIIAGKEEADSGKIIKRNNLYIRYLPQTPVLNDDDTVIESIIRENIENGEKNTQSWELEVKAKSFLNKLGITDYDAKVSTLSGGQKKRTALVSILLSKADLLILDEPTNHLDSEMCTFLENVLKQHQGSILMVTHDRYFLDQVADRIVELDNGKAYSYKANYSKFLELKQERMDMAAASERKRQTILRKELQWIMRGAKARTTKQKGRIQRFEALRDEEGPKAEQTFQFTSAKSRLGRTTVELGNVSKSFDGRTVVKDFSYIFLKNDRIGIVGKNGSGKSTLMKLIAGWIKPDSGEIVIGQTVRIGFFSQENEKLPENEKVIDYIKEVAEYIVTPEGSVSASQMLERFLFTGAMQHSFISKLSGGEKRRLYLLRILMDSPNFLILDEPTNDLDIETMTILEDYLDSFNGIVVTVSHDRYFLDRITDRIFVFSEDGSITRYEGGYTDYINSLSEEETAEKNTSRTSAQNKLQSQSTKEKPRLGPKKLKFTYKEEKEWETIESDIAELEEKISEIEKEMLTVSNDFVRLSELDREKNSNEEKLMEKMERWEYLGELAAKIAEQE